MTRENAPTPVPSTPAEASIRCPCAGAFRDRIFTYDSPPPGETPFDRGGMPYFRTFANCGVCGHWFGSPGVSLSDLYAGSYVDATYGDRLAETFDRIVALPVARSDNVERCQRVRDFASRHFAHDQRTLLDVGSGTGVFPYVMKGHGWRCTALDPDPRACEHLRTRVGVAVIEGDLSSLEQDRQGSFDMVTLNKVIEHVSDPVAMLAAASALVRSTGALYVEVPDGDAAASMGAYREEFFVEHLHAFSLASFALTIARAGLTCVAASRLIEPSGKRTLAAFAVRKDALQR